MDRDFFKAKIQERRSCGQGSGCQTLWPWCFSLLQAASHYLATELGVDKIPPLCLIACPEWSPFLGLRKKKLMAMSSKKVLGEDLGPVCDKIKEGPPHEKPFPVGLALPSHICCASKFTNSALHSWGLAQPGLTMDLMDPHFTPGSSLLEE